mgnify:CR=1 FL=1
MERISSKVFCMSTILACMPSIVASSCVLDLRSASISSCDADGDVLKGEYIVRCLIWVDVYRVRSMSTI